MQAAFATLAVEGKLVMASPHEVQAGSLAFVRVGGAALAFGLLAQKRAEQKPVVGRRDYALLALLSVLGIALNQGLFLAGLKRTSPLAATAIAVSIPVFSTLIESLSSRKLPGGAVLAGTSLAALGVLVLSRFTWPAPGDALVLLNALAYAIYVVLARPVVRRLPVGVVMRWVFCFGALWLTPWTLSSIVEQAPRWGASTWALLLYLVGVPTVFAYGANAWALRFAPPSLVTTYIYLQPPLVALWAWVRLGAVPQARLVIATLLILLGVSCVAFSKPPARG
ncbi:MAG TPA: DMT family transporter [Polyangiaceae bacterium]|nr:DMT family transporter [Polyangiaceae bacterium]